MQRDREPQSSLVPPPYVMRSAFTMMVPFALVWAIAGSVVWHLVLDTYGATWPAPLRDDWLAWLLTAVYAVFGVVCALALRWFIWVAIEGRPRKTELREVRARKDIKIGRDWGDV
jgi:hypothetical protein